MKEAAARVNERRPSQSLQQREGATVNSTATISAPKSVVGEDTVCIDCGNVVQHDTEAEWWLRSTVLYDPNVLDVDNSGRSCPETGDEHRLAPAATDQPCTHHGVTREHIEQCCAEGVDCDRCSKLITWEQLRLSVDQVIAAGPVLCSDCAREDWDCGSGQCDPNTGCPACSERDSWTRAR